MAGRANNIPVTTPIVGGSTFLPRIHRVTANVKTNSDMSHIMMIMKMEKNFEVADRTTLIAILTDV